MLPYLGQDIIVTILVICLYITNRFLEYEMISNALGPPLKAKEPKTPRLPNVEITAGAATIANGTRADGSSGQGGRGGRGGGGGRGGQRGLGKWPDTGHPVNKNTGGRPPGKKRNEKPSSCI